VFSEWVNMKTTCASACSILLAILLLNGVVLAQESELTQTQKVHHFLNRFSLGATPALMRDVERKGIDFWFDAHLAGVVRENPFLVRRLDAFSSLKMSSREIVEEFAPPLPANATLKDRQERNRLRNIPRNELRDATVLRAVYSSQQVHEAAVDFFRNHFCVAVDKGRVRYYATEYEREVIRRRVFGRFGNMLHASAKHPAMLVYLDNVVSRRPATKAELKVIELRVRAKTKSKDAGKEASEIASQRGLNENYARELLELHTLGVDNYYTQRDVENVAAALTGWTVSGGKENAHVFEFRNAMHVQGNKHVLGRTLAREKKSPVEEGERVLDMLVEHKGAARFLSWKLCRWFVNDDPSDDMVTRIAEVFRSSKGDLSTVYRAIVKDPAFFKAANYRTKLKRPYEFVVSALRATGADIHRCNGIHRALRDMSEDLFLCKDPTGYYDQAEAWQDPGAFAVRWKFAHDLARNKLPGVFVPMALYRGLVDRPVEQWNDVLAERLLPVPLDRSTSRAIDRVLAGHAFAASTPADRVTELAPMIVALILGSPDFQQQ
jgi:uncharacterized protein (DUF1800 family)